MSLHGWVDGDIRVCRCPDWGGGGGVGALIGGWGWG